MRRSRLLPAVALGASISFFQSCGGVSWGVSSLNEAQAQEAVSEVESAGEALVLERIAGPLEHPWSVAFLPGGDMLVTERDGRLRRVAEGVLLEAPIAGVPEVFASGQGGLFDVVLDPAFETNATLYLAYAGPSEDGYSTHLMRAVLEGDRLTGQEVLFIAEPGASGGRHFGGRIAIGPDGMLYLSIGDRGERGRAQDATNLAATIVRIAPDGSIPADNPFVGDGSAHDAVFAYGVRNPQGLAFNPWTGDLWEQEHGPRGGDEVNIIKAGLNYGWARTTHGRAYSGLSLGEGETAAGIEPPLHVWVPSIAPSGMAFYDDDLIAGWSGDLLIGALRDQLLVRLDLDETGSVVAEERLIDGEIGRIRDVRTGPDGAVWLLTDESDGGLYRLSPRD